MARARRWDVFCKVIDNWGDLGVCWRLCAGLALRGEHVRLWVDDPEALCWMAPDGSPGVTVYAWNQDSAQALSNLAPTDVVVEAFGCPLDATLVRQFAKHQPRWVNLEYLSAQDYVARQHGLPSPVLSGPGSGLTKRFYFPGFSAQTGGLLREPDLEERQRRFSRRAWLAQHAVREDAGRIISLFCYEPDALPDLLEQLACDPIPTTLLVTAGRATRAVQAYGSRLPGRQHCLTGDWSRGSLCVRYLPHLSQNEFDHLLWASDLNFVRGEDSLVRALWSGKPFIWNIYPQDDNAHIPKLQAFLDMLQAPPSLRQAHLAWNGVGTMPWPALDSEIWSAAALTARARLWQQPDLTSGLLQFLENWG